MTAYTLSQFIATVPEVQDTLLCVLESVRRLEPLSDAKDAEQATDAGVHPYSYFADVTEHQAGGCHTRLCARTCRSLRRRGEEEKAEEEKV